MTSVNDRIARNWMRIGARFLPFADAATAEAPMSRLLRLSLFQVTVGMALVLVIGTLNRVMIVELGVPATLVSVMVALPLLFAPLRAGDRPPLGLSPLRARVAACPLPLARHDGAIRRFRHNAFLRSSCFQAIAMRRNG